jgi:sugar O-acyltransferase (sialic acid O-acetyltransferase NeuD family)
MSEPGEVVVIGAGGHGKVVVSTLQAAGRSVAAVYDDDRERWGQELLGVPVTGIPSDGPRRGRRLGVIGVGDNRSRQRLSGLPFEWLSVVHPQAWRHGSVKLGAGTVLFVGSVVQPDARLGRHCIVNTGALIDHDSTLGNFVHVAPGARLAGGVEVGDGALLGIGCSVLPGVRIGEWSVVGAGATVVAAVPAGVTVRGVPAR